MAEVYETNPSPTVHSPRNFASTARFGSSSSLQLEVIEMDELKAFETRDNIRRSTSPLTRIAVAQEEDDGVTVEIQCTSDERYPKMVCLSWRDWVRRSLSGSVTGDRSVSGSLTGDKSDKEEEGREREEEGEGEEEEVEGEEGEGEVEVRSSGRCDAVLEIDGVCMEESGDGDRVTGGVCRTSDGPCDNVCGAASGRKGNRSDACDCKI